MNPSDPEYWKTVLGSGGGRIAFRSVPLSIGQSPYWHAGARIEFSNGRIVDAAVALTGPEDEPRRLGAIEDALISGILTDADSVLDAVVGLVDCKDDTDGSAASKNYLAGWVCADVVGRCLS